MQLSPQLLGAALSAIGLVGYLATGRKSVTALIPLFFGVAFIGLDWLGAHNVALGLSVLGFLGTGRALAQLASGPRGAAVVAKSAMALACLAFVAQGVTGVLG